MSAGSCAGSKSSKTSRLKIMEIANSQLFGREHMDLGMSAHVVSPDALTQDYPDYMDVCLGKTCATQTKPAISNKYAKWVGAKKPNKLEIVDNASASYRCHPRMHLCTGPCPPGVIISSRIGLISRALENNYVENPLYQL